MYGSGLGLELFAELDALLSLYESSGEVGCPAGDEVGDEADQHVAQCEGSRIQSEGGDALCDAEVDQDLGGVDVGEDTAVGVAVVGSCSVVAGLVEPGMNLPMERAMGLPSMKALSQGSTA